ncbi:MAG: hypothetical protein CMO55_14620 [Verrucomicrobiales bacterium]|nr:hypothetical protein [Verrucomicrobiales bacterium]
MKSILARLGTASCLLLSFTIAPVNAHDLVSADDDEAQGTENAFKPTVSGSGRYVVFHTEASLLPEDDNLFRDVYWRDRETRELRLISQNAEGEAGNGDSNDAVISANGAFVAFQSTARNFVDDDPGALIDIFVCEIATGEITMISRSPSGERGNGSSTDPSISYDGSMVAFQSAATNLSPLDTMPDSDIYARSRTDDSSIVLVSRNASDAPGNSAEIQAVISGDGEYVAFTSFSDNLLADDPDTDRDVYLFRLDTGTLELVSYDSTNTVSGNGLSQNPSLNESGRVVVFYSTGTNLSGDDNDALNDVFIRYMDAMAPENILVSVNNEKEKSNLTSVSGPLSLSSDGQFVAFRSQGTNMGASNANAGFSAYHIYLRDVAVEKTILMNDVTGGADDSSDDVTISADGETVVYESDATNLVNFDYNGSTTDVFASPGRDFTFDREARAAAIQKAILRAKLTKKLRKFKKKLRKVRRAKKAARVKAFKKKIRKVKKQLRSL